MTREEREAAVDWFAEQMKAKLREPRNEAKGGWRDSQLLDLYDRLWDEQDELRDVLDNESNQNMQHAIDEAVDVANFAMMIADRARLLKG